MTYLVLELNPARERSRRRVVVFHVFCRSPLSLTIGDFFLLSLRMCAVNFRLTYYVCESHSLDGANKKQPLRLRYTCLCRGIFNTGPPRPNDLQARPRCRRLAQKHARSEAASWAFQGPLRFSEDGGPAHSPAWLGAPHVANCDLHNNLALTSDSKTVRDPSTGFTSQFAV